MQAILCKFLPATDTKDYRIKAKCAAGSLTIDQPSDKDGQSAARIAAEALIKKLGWTEQNGYHDDGWLGGCLPSGDYVFVCNSQFAKE